MTENVTENVSLRMGKEDLQKMDDFLKDHPEMGGRSLFIRTAINHYINRDADVRVDQNGDGLYVRFTAAELAAMDNLVARGMYLNREEIVRSYFKKFILEPQTEKVAAQQALEATTSQYLQQ